MSIVAARAPVTLGVNVILMAHAAPGANDPPQVLVSEKSPLFVPPTVTPVMFSTAVPLLVSVTAWAAVGVPTNWVPKATDVLPRLTLGIPPVPLSTMMCGVPMVLSVMWIVAVRLPSALGVNVTLIVHIPPAATEVPQVLVSEKSPGFAPIKAMLPMVTGIVPVLESVIVCTTLLVFSFWLAKVSDVEDRLTSNCGGSV
jgi:hypothetical protein